MTGRDGPTLWQHARGDMASWRAVFLICIRTWFLILLLFGLYFYARFSRAMPVPFWAGDATALLMFFAVGVIGYVSPKRGDALAWAARGLLLIVCIVGGVYLANAVFFGGPSTPLLLTFLYLALGSFSIVRQGRLRSNGERDMCGGRR